MLKEKQRGNAGLLATVEQQHVTDNNGNSNQSRESSMSSSISNLAADDETMKLVQLLDTWSSNEKTRMKTLVSKVGLEQEDVYAASNSRNQFSNSYRRRSKQQMTSSLIDADNSFAASLTQASPEPPKHQQHAHAAKQPPLALRCYDALHSTTTAAPPPARGECLEKAVGQMKLKNASRQKTTIETMPVMRDFLTRQARPIRHLDVVPRKPATLFYPTLRAARTSSSTTTTPSDNKKQSSSSASSDHTQPNDSSTPTSPQQQQPHRRSASLPVADFPTKTTGKFFHRPDPKNTNANSINEQLKHRKKPSVGLFYGKHNHKFVHEVEKRKFINELERLKATTF